MAERSVSVLLLYNAKGEILLQHRTEDSPRYPGVWAFFGGGIEDNETPSGALRREILEELSYAVQDPVLVHEEEYTSGNGETGMKYVYVERYDSSQNLVQHEGQGMGWFLPDAVKNLPTIPHDAMPLSVAAAYIREHL